MPVAAVPLGAAATAFLAKRSVMLLAATCWAGFCPEAKKGCCGLADIPITVQGMKIASGFGSRPFRTLLLMNPEIAESTALGCSLIRQIQAEVNVSQ